MLCCTPFWNLVLLWGLQSLGLDTYLLLQKDIDITIVNNAGYNCLHLAVQYNKCNTKIIALLLNHHQSSTSGFVNKINKYGSTPLDLTRYNSNLTLRTEITKLLKGKGGKWNKKIIKNLCRK